MMKQVDINDEWCDFCEDNAYSISSQCTICKWNICIFCENIEYKLYRKVECRDCSDEKYIKKNSSLKNI